MERQGKSVYWAVLEPHGRSSPASLNEDTIAAMKRRFHAGVFQPTPAILDKNASLRLDWTDGVRHVDSWFFYSGGQLWEFAIGRAYEDDGGLPDSDVELIQSLVDSVRLLPASSPDDQDPSRHGESTDSKGKGRPVPG